MAKRIVRDMSTPENAAFWARAEQAAPLVEAWPDWKRTGVNDTQVRTVARRCDDGEEDEARDR